MFKTKDTEGDSPNLMWFEMLGDVGIDFDERFFGFGVAIKNERSHFGAFDGRGSVVLRLYVIVQLLRQNKIRKYGNKTARFRKKSNLCNRVHF